MVCGLEDLVAHCCGELCGAVDVRVWIVRLAINDKLCSSPIKVQYAAALNRFASGEFY